MKKIFLYYIAIAVSLFVFAGFLTGFLPNTSALLVSADPMGEMDVVVVGKIISATPNYDDVETEYVAEIEEIVKGWDLLESGNQTKSIRFSSPGILGYEDESYHHVYDKIFQTGDRALLMLNQRNGVLHESLWSRITTSDCRGDEIAQLHYAPGGLHLSQGGSDESPFYTNEPITAKFYYFNKELSNKTVNIEFVVVDDFPDVYHSENVTLSLKRCQPYAEASTEFIMSEPSTFAIRAIAGDNEGGSQSFSGVKVIDYVLSPLNQLTSGIPINEIQCREEMILITKLSDGSPACVRSETKQKLIERGWAENRPVSFRAPPGSLRVPQEVISITINDNDMPVIPIKRGETREIGVLVAPKIPIILSSVYIESYFGSACDSQNSTAYCPGKNITMKLSDESLTSQKEITLTVIVPNNMTVGQYGYKIVAKTTFDSPYYDDPLTVENSTRFDLLVQ